MGFAKIGQRSRKARSKAASDSTDTISHANNPSSSDIANSAGLEPTDKDLNSTDNLAQHVANVELASDMNHDSSLSPSAHIEKRKARQLTSFECLPVEILQRVFLLSLNPDLPATSYHLLTVLSSPYLFTHFFASAVLDETLERHEYKRVMSYLLRHPLIDKAFLLRMEDMLWNKKFDQLFREKFPSVSITPFTGNGLGMDPQYHQWWNLRYVPEGGTTEQIQSHYFEALSQRMIEGKLDLRTVAFPKKRLLPPYSLAQFEYLNVILYRMPYAFSGVSNGEAGRRWCDWVLEIAVRERCAAMVFLLLNIFFVEPQERHVRLALLPSDYGNTGWLAPEWVPNSGRAKMTAEDDLEALYMFRGFEGPSAAGSNKKPRTDINLFLDMMKNWEKGVGTLIDKRWPGYTQEMADSMRVLFAFKEHGRGAACRLVASAGAFPQEFTDADILRDVEIWQGALETKGPLLDWLMDMGEPPAGLLNEA